MLLRNRNEIKLLARNVTAKDLGFDPVRGDEDTVSCYYHRQLNSFIQTERKGGRTAKNHTQIRTSPEEICHRTTTGNVSTNPADIGNRALLADIRQTSLMRVLEGTDLFRATELALPFLDLGKDFVARFVVFGFLLRDRQFLEFVFEGFGFGHCVE